MAMVSTGRFNSAFVPDAEFLNALFGLLVGEAEGPSDWSNGGGATQVSFDWIFVNIPNPDAMVRNLVGMGYAIHYEYESDGSHSFALTADAQDYLHEHHNLPAPDDDEEWENYEERRTVWVAKQIAPRFRRKAEPQKRKCGSSFAGPQVARRTSIYVQRISYTPEEAVEAHAEIQAAYYQGVLTERQQAGYKAVVTRRIAPRSR